MACRADLEQLDLQMGLLDVHTKQLMRMQSSIAPMNQDSGGANGGSSPSQQSDQAAEVRKTKKLFSCRACADCGTQFTSQWRVGPYGPSTLVFLVALLLFFFLLVSVCCPLLTRLFHQTVQRLWDPLCPEAEEGETAKPW